MYLDSVKEMLRMTPAVEAMSSSVVESRAFGVPVPGQPVENPLSPEEIERFRQQLQHLRQWLLTSIAQLETRVSSHAVRLVSYAEHDDAGQAAWEQTMTQLAISDKRLLLHEVTQALERMKDNSYGRCVADNASISRSLLENIPWARFCDACACRHDG
jgi:RNA polymerase-binding transcription factor DksA